MSKTMWNCGYISRTFSQNHRWRLYKTNQRLFWIPARNLHTVLYMCMRYKMPRQGQKMNVRNTLNIPQWGCLSEHEHWLSEMARKGNKKRRRKKQPTPNTDKQPSCNGKSKEDDHKDVTLSLGDTESQKAAQENAERLRKQPLLPVKENVNSHSHPEKDDSPIVEERSAAANKTQHTKSSKGRLRMNWRVFLWSFIVCIASLFFDVVTDIR